MGVQVVIRSLMIVGVPIPSKDFHRAALSTESKAAFRSM